jgi:DnaK suppressor protein
MSVDLETSALHEVTEPAAAPVELLRGMLEDEFAVQTARLTQLTVYARLPRHAGFDQRTLEAHARSARERIADTAYALRRMSEGTYGVCAACRRPIPLGRLRAAPSATCCARCDGSNRPGGPHP